MRRLRTTRGWFGATTLAVILAGAVVVGVASRDPAVVMVEGVPIRLSAVTQHAAEEAGDWTGSRRWSAPLAALIGLAPGYFLVPTLVDEQLVRAELTRRGLCVPEAEIEAELRDGRGENLAEAGISGPRIRAVIRRERERELLATSLLVPLRREDLRRHFEETKDRYFQHEEVRPSVILVREQGLATRIRAQLQLGASFGELAQRHSLDVRRQVWGDRFDGLGWEGPRVWLAMVAFEEPLKTYDGELRWIRRGHLGPSFDAVAFTMPVGQVSAPVREHLGWYLIRVNERKQEHRPTFDEVAGAVTEDFSFPKRLAACESWLGKRKREVTIEYAWGFGPGGEVTP